MKLIFGKVKGKNCNVKKKHGWIERIQKTEKMSVTRSDIHDVIFDDSGLAHENDHKQKNSGFNNRKQRYFF